jgi:AcrR family transcriptional regulator
MERLTAEERRAVVLEAAMTVLGVRGFLGTPTIDVAEAAGISHAYLFRLFPKKVDLVLAVVHRSNQRIYDAFAEVAAQARAEGRDPRETLGEAYAELLQDRRLLLTQIHQHAAAAAMPEVAKESRASFERLVALVQRETGASPDEIQRGASPDEIQRFFVHGMLMSVLAAIDAQDSDGPWAAMLRVCPTYPPGDPRFVVHRHATLSAARSGSQ